MEVDGCCAISGQSMPGLARVQATVRLSSLPQLAHSCATCAMATSPPGMDMLSAFEGRQIYLGVRHMPCLYTGG